MGPCWGRGGRSLGLSERQDRAPRFAPWPQGAQHGCPAAAAHHRRTPFSLAEARPAGERMYF